MFDVWAGKIVFLANIREDNDQDRIATYKYIRDYYGVDNIDPPPIEPSDIRKYQ